MNLLLWRHASADSADDPQADLVRGLNARGRKQAAQMAAWLEARLPTEFVVVTGPALRTRQTAAFLNRPVRVESTLGPEATADMLLAAVGWPDYRGTTILVGHQPALGRVAARSAA